MAWIAAFFKLTIRQATNKVTKPIPPYLRVHRGDEPAEIESSDLARLPVEDFWTSFSDVTGWRMDRRSARRESEIELIPAVSSEALEEDGLDAESQAAVSRKAATQLAQSAIEMEQELSANREALRRQEAELAMRAPILTSDSDCIRVADRIESTLADAAASCGCDAAAMYMLDEDTQNLSTRAIFGLPPQRLEQPPRPLRGSRGDLEAMVQMVVTIDDFDDRTIDLWNCPEAAATGQFSSGICAAIQSDDVPIGTLWLFRHDRAQFGLAEAAAARMAATQLSLELSNAPHLGNAQAGADGGPARDIAQWQFDALPIGVELAEGWRVDGMLESPRPWATGWHDWDVLPDGTLMLAIAEAVNDSVKGALNATVARAALTAHTGYRHTPRQLLQRVSDTLWQTSTSEQLVSMLYIRVDPETGEGEVASSGSITALIASRYGYRPLVNGSGEPLNTYIDAGCVTETFRMMQGETLLAYSRGIVSDGASQTMLGDGVRTAMQAGDINPLAQIRRQFIDLPLGSERGAMTLLRQ
jgi:sigma-B regulation protein RsbU (phosphoserine phosphatase)